MFNRLKLAPKIGILIAAALTVTTIAGFFITQRRMRRQAEEAFVNKLRETDAMANHMRAFFSDNVEIYAPRHEFKDRKQVRVVGPWSGPAEYAESQGMKFSPPSLHPRNPANNPDDFEAK